MDFTSLFTKTPKTPVSTIQSDTQISEQTKSMIDHLTEETKKATEQLQERIKQEEQQRLNAESNKKALLNILEDSRLLEDQIRRQRDRLEGIISAVGEGLVVLDEHYNIQMMNPAAEQLLEVTLQESKNKNWNSFVKIYVNEQELSEQERPLTIMYKEKKSIKKTIDDNLYYENKKGRKFPISLSLSPLTDGDKIIGSVIVFTDITHEKDEKNIIEQTVAERTQELKTKNEALEKAQLDISQGWLQAQREKARLTASMNSLPIGFILTDKDQTIFMINQAAKSILSITSEVYQVESLQNILKQSCNIVEMVEKTKESKSIVKAHDILIGITYLNITIVPILLDVGNEFLGTAIVVEDITERKITERARDEFFSIASHELRTPLTAIRGNTAMIIQYFSDQLKGNKELTEMIEDIHSSSVRLITIVNDFLNVSRLEMKKMTYKKSSFDLKELVEKVHKELDTNCTEKHDTLEIHELTTPLPHVFADPDRTKEVLFNLIGNAIKYTDNGLVKTELSVKDGQLYIAITDAGLGIPKERWDLLFRKFQQAGENLYTRDTSRSTGLGLYISKLMVEEMGGTIGLERSEVGKGSTFFFTLKIATDKDIADLQSVAGSALPAEQLTPVQVPTTPTEVKP